MKDRELCTNNTTDCNGKKRKTKQSEERRKMKKCRSQDKPYFARKSAWVSLSGIIS